MGTTCNEIMRKKQNDLSEPVTYYDEFGNKHNMDWYRCWCSLHQRGNEYYQKRFPTYIGVSVCDEWYLLSNFKKFYEEHYQNGYVLDKDLLFPDNKIYSPHTCVFVPSYINGVISLNHNNTLLKGVYYVNKKNLYHARGYKNGNRISLGYYKTELEAHIAWQYYKIEAIHNCIQMYKTEPLPLPNVIESLYVRIEIIQNHILNGEPTNHF